MDERTKSSPRAAVLLSLLFAVLSIVMAFPHVGSFSEETVGDYGDGAFVQWVLEWNVHAWLDPNETIFDMNAFWPAEDTLAYSDPLLLPSALHGLFSPIVGDVVSFNLIYLLTWFASLWGSYLLCLWFSHNRLAAVLGAIAFTFAAPRLAHHAHYQLNFSFLIPFAFYFFVRLIEARKVVFGVLLGLAMGVLAATTIYYAVIMAAAMVILTVAWSAFRLRRLDSRLVGGFVAAAVLSGAIVLPIVPTYLELHDKPEFQRGAEPAFAAHVDDFIYPAISSYVYRGLDKLAGAREKGIENRLFPGALAFLLGAAGLVVVVRRRHELAREGDRWLHLIALTSVGALFLLLSFGHRMELGSRGIDLPYRLLEDNLPGFSGMRATSRFVVLPLAVGAVFVAFGAAWFLERWKSTVQVAVWTAIGLVMLAEYAVPIVSVDRVDDSELAAVNRALSELPEGPVAELPLGDPRTAVWAYVDAPRMLLSKLDWQPRLNGYSGFFPPGHIEVVATMNQLGLDEESTGTALRLMRALEIKYLVIRRQFIGIPVSEAFLDDARAEVVTAAIPREWIRDVRHYPGATLLVLDTSR